MKLPQGYIEHRSGNRICFLKEDLQSLLGELGFLDGAPSRAAESTLVGREEHPVFTLPGAGFRVLWKRCRRGGLVEPILKDRHLGMGRFLRELHLCVSARQAGIPVAETLAVAVENTPLGWKRVELLTRVVDGARDLEQALLDDELPPPVRQRLIRRAAHELRRFHGCGFVHGDLNLKNVLWRVTDDHEITVTFIDLDPGPLGRPLATPQKNLLRLYRSYLKGAMRDRWQVSALDLYRFGHGYFRGDRAALLTLFAAARRLRGAQRLHRAGENGAGGGRAVKGIA